MKKSVVVLAAFICMIIVSFAFTKADPPRYKNLKILPKDITKEQMDSVMHHFAGALGQKCSYCHMYNQEQKSMDFASDENKHKGAARGMLKMMYKLNRKFFEVKNSKDLNAKLEITCYTCHHGAEHPATKGLMTPMPPQGQPGPPPPSTNQ